MNNKKLYYLKKGFLFFVMALLFSMFFNFYEEFSYAALPELKEITEEEYYGRNALSKMEDAEKYLFMYDQMVKGVGSAEKSIQLYDGKHAVTIDDLNDVYETFINDYPQYFWIDNGFTYSYNSTTIVSFSPNYYTTINDLENSKKQFEVGIAELIAGIDASMSEFERELIVHDRIANKVIYDMEATNAHSAYGVAVDGLAVCDGYSRAFQYAMYKLGIQCQTVTGTSDGGGHAWNIVRIDGKYYYVDLTWNDKSESTQIYYTYLNVPLSEMEDSHILDIFIEVPECNSWDANYFTIFGGRIESPSVDVFVSLMNDDLNGRFYITGDNSIVWEWFRANRTEIAEKIGINSTYSSGYRRMGKEWNLYFKNCTRDEIPVTSVLVNKDSYVFNEEGDSFTISATVYPADAQNKKVYYSSSNTDVAIVNKYTGLVTCVGEGTANIIAMSDDNGLTDICEVCFVKEPLAASLQVEDSTEALVKAVGSKITLNAVAVGGSGEYTYKFAVLNVDTGKWSLLQDFSKKASYTYALNYPGAKQFAVTVKDSLGTTVATNRINVDVKTLSASLTVEGSTAEIIKLVGSKVKLDAEAICGSGEYTYKFAVLNVDTGKWSLLQDYSKNASYTFALNYTGTKQFAVTVKDSAGNTVSANRITVKVIGKDGFAGILTADGVSDVLTKDKGSKITLTANGIGGNGEYTYKFAVLNVDNGKWSVLRDFSEDSLYTYSLNYPGTKQFAVTVKDSTGKTVATNRITVKVIG